MTTFFYLSSSPHLNTCFPTILPTHWEFQYIWSYHCFTASHPFFPLFKFHGLLLITPLDISLISSLDSSYSPGKTVTLIGVCLFHSCSQEADHDWKKNDSVKRSHFKFMNTILKWSHNAGRQSNYVGSNFIHVLLFIDNYFIQFSSSDIQHFLLSILPLVVMFPISWRKLKKSGELLLL